MVIQHNLSALNAHRQLAVNNSQTSGNLEKLSSGYRVNRAADDAAGLAISEKMRGQIRGLDMATTNAENGVSLIQTAEGGLNETHSILQRMRELAVQASNGTYHDQVDRENIDKEMQSLKDEIERISTSTHYNGIKLLDGSMSKTDTVYNVTRHSDTVSGANYSLGSGLTGTMTFQIGANGSVDQRVTLDVSNMGLYNLGATSVNVMPSGINGASIHAALGGIKVVDVKANNIENANHSIVIIDMAINQVSGTRADLGALQNRLEHTINSLGITRENLQAAESSIRDVDMAKEMMEFTKNNILAQASQSMLAQANQLPQGVLQLLR